MPGPKDFLAKQIRTGILLLSGGAWPDDGPWDGGLLIYSASEATDYSGGKPGSGWGQIHSVNRQGLIQIVQSNTGPNDGLSITNLANNSLRFVVDKDDFRNIQADASEVITFHSASVWFLSGNIATGQTDPRPANLDANFWVSGSTGKRGHDPYAVGNFPGTAVFGGDLVVSGTLFAETTVIEVTRNVSGGFYVSGSAEIGGGLIVNEHGGSAKGSDFSVRSQHSADFFYADASKEMILVYSGSSDANHTDDSARPAVPVHVITRDDSTNDVVIAQRFQRYTTGTPAAGFGVGMDFRIETSVSNNETVGVLEAITTDGSAGTEDGAFIFKTMTSGATATEKFRIGSGETVANEGGINQDFRVEGENESHLLWVDASAELVRLRGNAGDDTVIFQILGNSDAADRSADLFSVSPTEVSVNEGSNTVDFRVETAADDKALVVSSASEAVIVNEDGDGVDFRVETANEDEAFFIDSSADTIYVNKGESAVTTIIGNANDEAIRIDATGVVFNDDHHATNDFRVESDNGTHAIFVDAGSDVVHINQSEGAVTTQIHSTNDVVMTVNATGVVFNDDHHATNDFRIESDAQEYAFFVDSGNERLTINSGSTGFTTAIHSKWGEAVTVNAGGTMFNRLQHASNDLRVLSSGDDNMFVVDSANNEVGIGVSPDSIQGRLHVSDDGHCYSVIESSDAGGSGDAVLSYRTHGANQWAIGVDHSDYNVLKVTTGSNLSTAANSRLEFRPAVTVFNNGAQAVDFRVEGANDASLLIVDASTDTIGINVAAASHSAKLDILADDSTQRGLRVKVNPGKDLSGGDILQLFSGSAEVFSVSANAGDVVVNEAGESRDFRVESLNSTSMLFVDGSADAVGIGVTSPDASASLTVGHPQSNAAAVILVNNVSNIADYDAQISFAKQGTVKHTIGMDDSDSDKLKIALAGILGASNKALMDFPSAVGSAIVVNEDARDHDFRIETTSDPSAFIIDAGDNVVNVGSAAGQADFRVQTANEDEALFVDASADAVYINKGKNAVTTVISCDNDDAISVNASGVILNQQAHADNDFRVESTNLKSAILVDSGLDAIVIGAAQVDPFGASFKKWIGTDVRTFFTTGSSGSARDTHAFEGSVVVTGSAKFIMGMTGSLTKLTGGTPYLRGGTHIKVTTASNGSVVIAAPNAIGGTGAASRIAYYDGAQTITSDGDLTFDGTTLTVAKSAVFNEGGGAANDFRVESDEKTHAFFVDAGTNQVFVLSGTDSQVGPDSGGDGTDIAFYVSGSATQGVGGSYGISMFGGDVVVSGTIYDGTGTPISNNYGRVRVLDSGESVEGTCAAGQVNDIIKLKEGAGIGLTLDVSNDMITLSAALGSGLPSAFTDRGVQGTVAGDRRGPSIICTSSISFVSGNHIGGVSPVAYDAVTVGHDVFFFVSGSQGGKGAVGANRHGVAVFGGDAVFSGSTYFAGSMNIGDATSDTVNFTARANSHILPAADSTYNLGSAALRWNNIYTGDLHLRNDRGNWTIYEEPDMLVVVNNLTGKKYKMGLTPLEDDE